MAIARYHPVPTVIGFGVGVYYVHVYRRSCSAHPKEYKDSIYIFVNA